MVDSRPALDHAEAVRRYKERYDVTTDQMRGLRSWFYPEKSMLRWSVDVGGDVNMVMPSHRGDGLPTAVWFDADGRLSTAQWAEYGKVTQVIDYGVVPSAKSANKRE